MEWMRMIENVSRAKDTAREAMLAPNAKVLRSLLGPAYRGMIEQVGKRHHLMELPTRHDATFDFEYRREVPELAKLYTLAKRGQWDSDVALDWKTNVDPEDERVPLIDPEMFPLAEIPAFQRLDKKTQARHQHHLLAWLMSQFLHGEQGALFAAAQVTQAVPWTDGKFYGSTQVMDEGRHVEVFHRYLTEKIEKLYEINDNLYVVIDALMTDARWDMKFLGMQIMIEGLALGAFGTLRSSSKEPLLRELLRYVITDEARHVHFGVVALERHYRGLSPKEREEREDWAFEMSLLMRNRFLAHEFFDEHYAPLMSRKEWDERILASRFMSRFRRTMFRRVIPNLARIGLLSPRVRPHYEALGLMVYAGEKAAPDLTADDLERDEPEIARA